MGLRVVGRCLTGVVILAGLGCGVQPSGQTAEPGPRPSTPSPPPAIGEGDDQRPQAEAQLPREKAGKFVVARDAARIEIQGKTYPLFVGHAYRLLDRSPTAYTVDYCGCSGTIPVGSCQSLDDAYEELVAAIKTGGLRAPLFTRPAESAHIAIGAGDLAFAELALVAAESASRDRADPSTILARWEWSVAAGGSGRPDVRGLQKAYDANPTYELGHALVRAHLSVGPRYAADPWHKSLPEDRYIDPEHGYSGFEVNLIEPYFKASSQLAKLKKDFPDFPGNLALGVECYEQGSRFGDDDKLRRYISVRAKREAADQAAAKEAREKFAELYKGCSAESASLLEELRDLVKREAAARAKLDSAESRSVINNGRLRGDGRELAKKWDYFYKGERPAYPPFVNAWQGRSTDTPAAIDAALSRLVAIQKGVDADPEKAGDLQTIREVVEIHRNAAGALGYESRNGVLPKGRRAPTGAVGVIALDAMVGDMEELVRAVESASTPDKK